MVNYDLIFLLVFYAILLVIFKIYRNKFEVQWKIFALYKTSWGIKLMDRIAKKFPKFLNVIGIIGIWIGFIGMAVTTAFIFYATYKFLFVPNTAVALAPLLPGVSISEGLPILSFWHWIIAILFVAIIHEASHGIYARLKNVKIKSSGFAFLGPILAAFVEPDEKQLEKKPIKDQLLVFSAGPFSNIIQAIIIFLFLGFIFAPIVSSMSEINGIVVGNINESLPINQSGLRAGHIIQEIDGFKIDNTKILGNVLENKKPGDTVLVKANETSYNVILSSNPKDKEKAFFGIGFSKYSTQLKNNSTSFVWLHKVLSWIGMLLFWIFNIALGVGLFNLLPLGPVDGGRMFYAGMSKFTSKKKAMKILSIISLIILGLILINMWPFIFRLFKFVLSPLAFLL
ncbi:MAG TPA: site-2 protease family protein [Candidatus Nanoarchaeia archaeon]|nr:site-2 protease family protein [Candidatus Nanoarchaeia archaeon]